MAGHGEQAGVDINPERFETREVGAIHVVSGTLQELRRPQHVSHLLRPHQGCVQV